jgi:dihydroorotate dehydrogenase electron transfer subunit
MRFTTGTIVRNEGSGPSFYRMEVELPAPVSFQPGQFAMVSGWPGNDPLLPRPLAVFRGAAAPGGKGTVEFAYKVVGRGTALLSGLHPGDPVSLTLPLGKGFDLSRERARHILVGGGVGFSSVFPAAAALAGRKAPFDLLFGARTRSELPPSAWIPPLGPHGKGHPCTEDGTAGFQGLVTEAARETLSSLPAHERERTVLLACGPHAMLRAVARIADEFGLPAQVSLESHMACGFGVCWGCVAAVKEGEGTAFRRVCKEGPVFDSREVAW